MWAVGTDGSVAEGGEMVSPILDFNDPHDRNEVSRAIELLKDAGCSTSRNAGVHVHVDATNLNKKTVASVAKFFTKYEDPIYRLASSGWETIRPCALRDYAFPFQWESKAKMIVTDFDVDQVWEAGGRDRYFGVNLQNLIHGRKETIEFRVFNSTLNGDRAQAYIALAVAAVRTAKLGGFKQKLDKDNAYPLGAMAMGLVSPKSCFMSMMRSIRQGGLALADVDAQRIRKYFYEANPQKDTGHRGFTIPGWLDGDPKFPVPALVSPRFHDDEDMENTDEYSSGVDDDFYCTHCSEYHSSSYQYCSECNYCHDENDNTP